MLEHDTQIGIQSGSGLSPNNEKKKTHSKDVDKTQSVETSIPQAKELRIAKKHEIPNWTSSECLDMHSTETINSEQCS